MFAPRNIAVVGVSHRTGSFGARAWANLEGFAGERFAVNPKYDSWADGPCYADIFSLPVVPDCVLLATAREQNEEILLQCAERGVRAAILFASGYAETGMQERIADQLRLRDIASRSGLRLLGPNCMGYVNNALRIGMTFGTSLSFGQPSGHDIGLVSQSGAIAFALMKATAHGKPFSHVLTSGNAVDVDVADQIAYLAHDPDCKAIACVIEGIADPARLIEAGLCARAAGKGVVVFKVARSPEGSLAALSHTGAMAGSDAAYAAAFERACMVQVDDIEHLLDTASYFAKANKLQERAAGTAVLSASGGMAIMAADKAALYGVPLPQPSEPTTAVLRARIPEYGSPRNPCDLTAQVINDPSAFGACAEALLSDAAYGTLVYPQSTAHITATQRLQTMNEVAAQHGKMVCVVWVTEWLEGPGSAETEGMGNVAIFRSMKACFAALHAQSRWSSMAMRAAREDRPSRRQEEQLARGILGATLHATLTEGESMRVLATYGIPVVSDCLVKDGDAAVTAASRLGYPVAMKIVSRDIPHKTDMGGVALGLIDSANVQRAFHSLMQAARTAAREAAIDGVVVQTMLPKGVELVLGSRLDPVFGPLLMVGMGGVMVEVLNDVAVRLPPVDHEEALEMLQGLRGARLLAGFRGNPSVDLCALADIVVRFSELVADLGDAVQEIDVNPLICSGTQIIAADALIQRSPTTVSGSKDLVLHATVAA